MGGKTYLDGGSVNNVPVDLLTDRGYKDLIVIRLYGIGVDRRRFMDIPEDVTVHEIAPKRNLGGILEFDSERTRKNMELGYFDGLRFLYGLCGRKYYLDMPYSEAYYFGRIMSELDMFKEWLRPYVKEEDFAKLNGLPCLYGEDIPVSCEKTASSPGVGLQGSLRSSSGSVRKENAAGSISGLHTGRDRREASGDPLGKT